MLLADLPAFFAKRWAADATGPYIRNIPATTADPAAASMSLGFPPQTFTDESAGGTPPDGRDFNGILNFLSAWAQWGAVGGAVPWNSTIGALGYPKGSRVMADANPALTYVAIVDGTTVNPNTAGSGTDWVIEGSGSADTNQFGGHITLGPLIFNFGQVVQVGTTGAMTVTFDKPFGGAVLAVGATNDSGGTRPAAWAGVGNPTLTTMVVSCAVAPSGGGSGVAAPAGTASRWWALGV